MVNKMQRVISQLEQVNERSPSEQEISEEMQITIEEVAAFCNCSYQYVSLDEPNFEESDNSRKDELTDEESAGTDKGLDHTESLEIEIKRVLATLNKKQSDILCKFFGIGIPQPLSLTEIGSSYNLSAERVRQIKNTALCQLRVGTKGDMLKLYLGA